MKFLKDRDHGLEFTNLQGHQKSIAMKDNNADLMVQNLGNFFIELI